MPLGELLGAPLGANKPIAATTKNEDRQKKGGLVASELQRLLSRETHTCICSTDLKEGRCTCTIAESKESTDSGALSQPLYLPNCAFVRGPLYLARSPAPLAKMQPKSSNAEAQPLYPHTLPLSPHTLPLYPNTLSPRL